ncbi:hypothetical protein SAMN02910358_00715 [Lachnospiraceae bacterium XBB1006]|nr:hypothetical protein SAMN02910358_00715 [Lachnospiraceae bacterium XBB1006]
MLNVKNVKVGETFYFVETEKGNDFKFLPHYGIMVKQHTISKVLKEPYGSPVTILDENETLYDIGKWKDQLFSTAESAELYAQQKEEKMDARYASAPPLKGGLVEWLPKYWKSKKGKGQQYIYLRCKPQDKEALAKDLQELGCRWKDGKTITDTDTLPGEIRIFRDYSIKHAPVGMCSGYIRHADENSGVLFLDYRKFEFSKLQKDETTENIRLQAGQTAIYDGNDEIIYVVKAIYSDKLICKPMLRKVGLGYESILDWEDRVYPCSEGIEKMIEYHNLEIMDENDTQGMMAIALYESENEGEQ